MHHHECEVKEQSDWIWAYDLDFGQTAVARFQVHVTAWESEEDAARRWVCFCISTHLGVLGVDVCGLRQNPSHDGSRFVKPG